MRPARAAGGGRPAPHRRALASGLRNAGSGPSERYRNKAQFPVAPGPGIGFYRPAPAPVTDVEDCLLQSEAAARLRTAAKAWMKEFHIPAYQERTGKADWCITSTSAPTGGGNPSSVCW